MAKKISFESEVDASGFSNGLKKMEAAAAAANGRMNRTVYEAQKRQTILSKAQIQSRVEYEEKLQQKAAGKAAYEERRSLQQQASVTSTFVTGRQAYGQAYFAREKAAQMRAEGLSRFGAASSMFVSAARDSAASLASGAPLMQVIAQQAPQVLQAVTMIGGGIMKWGLGLGAAAAALVGVHYLTKKIGKEFTGEASQEREIAMLDRRSATLKKWRAEQNAEFAKKDAEAERLSAENRDIIEIGSSIGEARLAARMAKESNPIARQKMLIDSLMGKETIAALDYERKSQTEFSGLPGERLAARKSELALAQAQQARIEAQSQLKDMESVQSKASRPSFFNGDALTQVGNFLGAGSGLVNSISQQQLDEARKQTAHLDKISKNTMPSARTSAETMDIP